MSGLPKIVRYRLGQPPSGAAGGDHPDANLLTGFIEHSLTRRERGLVLDHLAQCAGCRELVSLALPNPEGETAVTGVGAPRRWSGWLRWPVLRWSVLTASLVIMSTLALVRRQTERQSQLASRAVAVHERPAPLPSDVTIEAAPPKVEPSGQSPANALLKDKRTSREVALELEAIRKKADENRSRVQYALRSAEEPETTQAHTTVQTPTKALRTSRDSIASSNQPPGIVVLQPKTAPPSAPATIPSQGQPAAQSSDSLAADQAKGGSASRPSEAEKGYSVGGPAGGVVAGALHEQPIDSGLHKRLAPPPSSRATLAKSAPALASPAASLSAIASSPAGADWSISASGTVQRSLDGRKTWEDVDVDKNVVFRVVFAVGPDVWLGGTKGTLFHSTDGGQHWTRVTVAAGSATVTDDIVRIEFKDAQHGSVRTAGRENWVTSDGGQHWRQQ